MVDVVPPEIAPSGDLLLSEDFVEGVGVVDHFVFPSALTAAGDDLSLTVSVEVPGVVAVGKIEQRRIEIDVIVDVIADEVDEPVTAAKSDDGVADVGVAKIEVHGVVGAETTPGSEDIASSGHIVDEGNDFIADIRVVGVVPMGSVGGRNGFIHPRFIVDGSDGKEHDSASFDVIGDATDHAEIFVFVIAAA